MFSCPRDGAAGDFSAFAIAVEMIPVGLTRIVLVYISYNYIPLTVSLLGACCCFDGRPFVQLLEASDKVRKGLRPFRDRPYRPLPGPDIP